MPVNDTKQLRKVATTHLLQRWQMSSRIMTETRSWIITKIAIPKLINTERSGTMSSWFSLGRESPLPPTSERLASGYWRHRLSARLSNIRGA